MKFEVIDTRDGNKVKMTTEHKKCIYPVAMLKNMEAAGYKFRVNRKRWRPGQELPPETQKQTKKQ